jgi:hypothetical protein
MNPCSLFLVAFGQVLAGGGVSSQKVGPSSSSSHWPLLDNELENSQEVDETLPIVMIEPTTPPPSENEGDTEN